MITRIVKMEFRKDAVEDFRRLFDQVQDKILSFDGCESLQLLRDRKDAETFFTLSLWTDEKHLEVYRDSALFKETWDKTKKLFAARPKAWSLEPVNQ